MVCQVKTFQKKRFYTRHHHTCDSLCSLWSVSWPKCSISLEHYQRCMQCEWLSIFWAFCLNVWIHFFVPVCVSHVGIGGKVRLKALDRFNGSGYNWLIRAVELRGLNQSSSFLLSSNHQIICRISGVSAGLCSGVSVFWQQQLVLPVYVIRVVTIPVTDMTCLSFLVCFSWNRDIDSWHCHQRIENISHL